MGRFDGIDTAGRQIAGLLTYNPGPGIYSRLERAVEAMPDNVRVQELPGLLKRYKEGVPGWELKATDLDSTIAGRDVVPRDELLAAVRERSPVYTHGEVVLGGRPQIQHVPTGGTAYYYDAATDTRTPLPDDTRPVPDYQFPDTGEVSRLGDGVSHGEPRYRDYGQGGEDYAELLIYQPGPKLPDYGSHWGGDLKNAVAHARFDTHGDALRINELQSDLGIHNRKAREYADQNPQIHFGERLNPPEKQGLPFPLEDAWADLLIKRIALEAARKGHRAIEVASPRAIADKVGGNIDNYEHFYGKVVPGALERLGRKMGGLAEDATRASVSAPGTGAGALGSFAREAKDSAADTIWEMRRKAPGVGENNTSDAYRDLMVALRDDAGQGVGTGDFRVERDFDPEYARLYRAVVRDLTSGNMMEPRARKIAGEYVNKLILQAQAEAALRSRHLDVLRDAPSVLPGRRYIMSDEMRRRLIESGVGASVLAPLMMQGEE